MKTAVQKLALFLAVAAISLSPAAAQNLTDQISAAAKVAVASGAPEDDAKAIAESLGNAFGPQGDFQALLNAVAQLVGAKPDQETAVAEAAKVFAKDQADQIDQVARAAAEAASGGGGGGGGGDGGTPPLPTGFGGGGGSASSSSDSN
jgi:hypothetical protein